MPIFKIGDDVATTSPTVEVTFDPTLTVGTHRFQLVVEDAGGAKSAPAFVEVKVLPVLKPTLTAPAQTDFGQSFTLDGSKSIASGSVIAKYHWTLLASQPQPKLGGDQLGPVPVKLTSTDQPQPAPTDGKQPVPAPVQPAPVPAQPTPDGKAPVKPA